MGWGKSSKKTFNSKRWLLKVTITKDDKEIVGFTLLPAMTKNQLLTTITTMHSKADCEIEVMHNFVEVEEPKRKRR